ncbi:TagK domain-containing protein [Paraburkholderia sabiae]|uniref:TagK domain-containing protein n=1 Tax=Paraburkholderia sabiae TaxID=273251 RepID=A0ABU9QSF9_9BURK|nr:TagK domain-containing protein [Paraburkholderia sabiae]WJZ79099.1 TagK domain-containing protein [Paraburkholderia sabiae]CAD6514245.1 hypothetical protein LMG24235_00871 [Paraburkholderia sabiae]
MAFSAQLSRIFSKTRVGADTDQQSDATATTGSGVQVTTPRGSDAIYELFGAPSDAGHNRAAHFQDEPSATTAPDDIIRRLNDQYYQAIASSRFSLTDRWVDSGLLTGEGQARQPWEEHAVDNNATGSISDLLADIEELEEAFGPLRHGESPEPVVPEPMPEILLLFAPPEFQATALRRPASLPPSLVRREHHTLAIDSPMVARDAASIAYPETNQ